MTGAGAIADPVPAAPRPEIAVVPGGALTPFRHDPAGRRASGCLYDGEGRKVALAERVGGARGDHVASDNPDRLAPAARAALPRLGGRALYLGHHMDHYGHFIVETLSTFWAFERLSAADFDHVVLHPFVFGTRVAPWAAACLAAFDVPEGRLRVLAPGEGAAFDEVVAPARLMALNRAVHPDLALAHRRIARRLGGAGDGPRRLYLSRRGLGLRGGGRAIANEAAVERLFAARGFAVLRPEATPLAAQVALYAGAEVLAGPSGSALHNVLFAPPGALVVELGDPRYRGEPSPTQALCQQAAGARGALIAPPGRAAFGGRVALVDVARLAPALDAALAAAPPAPPGAPPPRPPRLAEAAETLALLARAAARALRRRIPRRASKRTAACASR